MNVIARPFPAAFLLTGVICLLFTAYSETSEARSPGGARSGGGGYSRSSAASGGNFNARPATSGAGRTSAAGARSASGTQSVSGARSVSGAKSVSGARSAGGASSAGGAGSAGGVGSAGGFGQPGDRTVADIPPRATQLPADDARLGEYRQQFVDQNKDRWDDHIYVDDGTVVAARVVGTAVVLDELDDDYVNGAYVEPVYDTSMPCTVKAVASVDNVAYYRCETQWYRRGYQSDRIVYIPSDPPAGY